jgi:hypothetical protein
LVTSARPFAATDESTERFALSDSIDSSACSMTTSAPFSAACSAPRSRRMPSERGLAPVWRGMDEVGGGCRWDACGAGDVGVL